MLDGEDGQPRDLCRWLVRKTWRFHRSVALDGAVVDIDGTWARIRVGAEMAAYDDSMVQFEFAALVYFPADQWWNAIFLDGAPMNLHVDIGTPAQFDGQTIVTVDDGQTIVTVDLDLDVIVAAGRVAVVDRDEFDAHRCEHHYPENFVVEAQRAASAVSAMIATSAFPFDRTYTERTDELHARLAASQQS